MNFIMYVSTNYKGHVTGGQKRYKEILEYLLEEGYKIHFFLPKDSNIQDHNKLSKYYIKTSNIKTSIIPKGVLNFIINYSHFKKMKHLRDEKVIAFDVPHTIQFIFYGYKNINMFVRQDFIQSRKIFLDDKIESKFLKNIYIKIFLYLEKITLLRSKKIIVQCEYDKKELLKRHKNINNRIKDKIFVLNNNVNPSWIRSEECLVNKNDRCNGKIKLCFIGNIDDKRKGLDILLESFVKFSKNSKKNRIHAEMELNIIGGGNSLISYVEKYKKYKEIKFWGILEKPLKVLSDQNLLIVPSISDSFPNTVMEALFLEIPVIGSKVGGIPEILEYNDLLFEPNSVELYNKLCKIVKENQFEKLKELAKQRKEALSFNWGKEVEKVLLYD